MEQKTWILKISLKLIPASLSTLNGKKKILFGNEAKCTSHKLKKIKPHNFGD